MIPWFLIPPLKLGPLEVTTFGVFAAGGVWLASVLLVRGARLRKLDVEPVRAFSTWAVLGGVVGGHLMHLLFYHPEELRENGPLQLLKVWDGLSSTGGVLGGIVVAALFFRARRIPFARYADVLALAMAPGWAVARLGCFSVHDHPGRLTSFPLAVAFPGGARHDLGLYDALVLFGLTALLYSLRRRFAGSLLAILALGYGLSRFFLDFLRATDVPYADARYFGLTPAQYVAAGLVLYGLARLASRPPTASSRSDLAVQ